MKYIMLEWFHDLKSEPCIIYSEINNQRYEVRKIDVYKDGTVNKYDEKETSLQMELSDVAFPENLDAINQDKQFYAHYISRVEFENIWNNH